jgi:hypothetical protein
MGLVEWQIPYLAQQYMKIDPVVATARSVMRAFTWAAESPRRIGSKQLRRFYSEAEDFGKMSGISIPVRTAFGHMSSMLTFASQKPSLSREGYRPACRHHGRLVASCQTGTTGCRPNSKRKGRAHGEAGDLPQMVGGRKVDARHRLTREHV